jgi:hypothetical protein
MTTGSFARPRALAVAIGALAVLAVRSASAESAAMETVGSITQHGITWTLDKQYPVGGYVNGDYWVLGPVTVTSVSPEPVYGTGPQFEDARNGSMANPMPPRRQGYDGRAESYADELSVRFPMTLQPGQSLVSTISHEKTPNPEIFPHFEKADGVLKTAAVLTVVSGPPPADAFRPPFVGDQKPVLLSRALRRDKLPRLPLVPGVPKMADIEKVFERPWLDHVVGYTVLFIHPTENMPGYGREVARGSGFGALMLCLDFPPEQKEKLLIGYVQTGIDLYYTVQAGGGWPADGGHASGRKIVILIAGLMLDNADMLSVKGRFGEDMQTYYGKGWTGATALWQIYFWGGRRPPHEHLRPAEWAEAKDEAYRRCCTAVAWVGEALAARKLGLIEHWRHDAFFDYVDRWMTEKDTPEIQAAFRDSDIRWAKNLFDSPDPIHSGDVWPGWVREMWTRYRGPIEPLHPSEEVLRLISEGKPLPE